MQTLLYDLASCVCVFPLDPVILLVMHSKASSPSTFSPVVEGFTSASGSSTAVTLSSSFGREGEDHRVFDQHTETSYGGHWLDPYWNLVADGEQYFGVLFAGNWGEPDEETTTSRKDTWACVALIVVLCIFVPTCVFLGFCGHEDLGLRPNSSLLIRKNPYFIQNIKVEELDDRKHGVELYGFHERPPLDVATSWSETHEVFVPTDSHQAWMLYLNRGSQINISYSVHSKASSVLVIDQGFHLPEPRGDYDYIARWFDDPSYPNNTLSWNLIHGCGVIRQKIYGSSSYIVAVGNPNSEPLRVTLDFEITALLYNTTDAYFKCTIANGKCSLRVRFLNESFIVLTSPTRIPDGSNDEWHVRLSYGPRWILCILGMVGMVVLVLLGKTLSYKLMVYVEGGSSLRSERRPLVSNKVDDLSSGGSSYDDISTDEEGDLEDRSASKSLDNCHNNIHRLCAICYDAPRGCFFLPCGHCVACLDCGTRIAESIGSCPICRRKMRKVKRIFAL